MPENSSGTKARNDRWSTGDLARVLGVSRNTVRRVIAEHDLRGWLTPGGHLRLWDEDVQKLFKKIGFTGTKGNSQ